MEKLSDPQMILDRAKFALANMIGNQVIDLCRLQHILDGEN
jgi:hypothetical protein